MFALLTITGRSIGHGNRRGLIVSLHALLQNRRSIWRCDKPFIAQVSVLLISGLALEAVGPWRDKKMQPPASCWVGRTSELSYTPNHLVMNVKLREFTD
jgi:hypothetical protein